MTGYQILGGVVPPYQVLQQQNAGLPPGSVPPWYAMQYPAGYVPPLLVSVDNPLEGDPFDASDLLLRHHDEREQADLRRSHLLGGYAILGMSRSDTQSGQAVVEVTRLMNRIYAHRERDPQGGPDLLRPNVVTYRTAQDLTQLALLAIDKAKALAPEGWFIPSKAQTMANVRATLTEHERAASAGVASGSGASAYPDAEKLRRDVVKAFVEVEGSIAGASTASNLSYWSEVYDTLRSIGDTVLAAEKAMNKYVTDVFDDARKTVKTVYWTLAVLTFGIVGALGWALVRHGGTIGTAAVRRYLP